MSRPFTLPSQLTVPVNGEHIASGVPGSPCNCPIALALDDAYPLPTRGTWKVERCWATAVGIPGPPFFSKDLNDFVERFDSQKPVAPCVIVLEQDEQ